ncbi:GNAT family N-acetyltransferase [Alicyclobacillus fastidiosus]|uniref:GNAT family N-acetyltransferase n=1 Tax=Alicyclobacillus fastidiosus TaxID=392011 RepID=A0ABY6ZPR7_9BACL|nr:GNAT family protein [Alicyclobacillus fastidiosus]WAH43925.1 GNAT family N-acetyltransferase [Alicyclobacillus fastidiosus]
MFDIISVFHEWETTESHREMYTCRPLRPTKARNEYVHAVKTRIEQRSIRIFVLASTEDMTTPYGKITAFDFNPRNLSAEFGYYLPKQNRGQGYGQEMVSRFLNLMFKDPEWGLHKLYATTASGNIPSIKLLKGMGFHLDGIMREHYFIRDRIEDQLHFSLLKREWGKPSV